MIPKFDFKETHSERDSVLPDLCDISTLLLYGDLDNLPNQFINGSFLSKPEIERANKYVNQFDSTMFVARRSILRWILSQYTFDICPKDVQLRKSIHGKLHIENNLYGLEFNLSTSKPYLVICITKNHSIGVDLEEANIIFGNDEFIMTYLTKEELNLFRSIQPQKRLKAAQLAWGIKEANLKYLGYGFTEDPSNINLLTQWCDIRNLWTCNVNIILPNDPQLNKWLQQKIIIISTSPKKQILKTRNLNQLLEITTLSRNKLVN